MNDLRSEVERLKEKVKLLETVKETAKALDEKLDLIWKDPSYISQIQLASIHGYDYTGPNCGEDQRLLKEALKAVEEGK